MHASSHSQSLDLQVCKFLVRFFVLLSCSWFLEGECRLSGFGAASLPALSPEVRTDEITQTLLMPGEGAGISSVSVIGVASDGSGMTTFLYFAPIGSTTALGVDLPLAWNICSSQLMLMM